MLRGEARSAMVSSAHPLATEAGVEILRAGGSAFEAAVAVAAALNVVEPGMSGLGGYGTILVYEASSRRVSFLDSSGRIPIGVRSDAFRAPTPGYEQNRRSAKAISTPGNLHAWEALAALGRLPWAELLAPAISLAERGFVLDAHGASWIAKHFDAFPAHAQRVFGRDGKALAPGDRLVQADLAGSLRLVAAHGAAAFYTGDLARAIVRAVAEDAGFLSAIDLATHRAEWFEPIKIEHRGYDVYTASPPATSFDALVRIGTMGCFDLRALGQGSVAYLHRFAEVTKQAFHSRLVHSSDPDVAPVPLARLLSRAYWAEAAARIDLARATPFVHPTASDLDGHTTHFVVADRAGNIVSATQTLGNVFGSRIMPPGTGIWLNNSLAYCTFEPKGNPMDAHAGRRKLSGDCPTILVREGRPWAALGTPGGHTISQTVPQIVLSLVDFGRPIDEAIAAPRISFVEPDFLDVEEAVPPAVRDGLAALGHPVRVVPRIGSACGLTIEHDAAGDPAAFVGAADPRGAGSAAGYG